MKKLSGNKVFNQPFAALVDYLHLHSTQLGMPGTQRPQTPPQSPHPAALKAGPLHKAAPDQQAASGATSGVSCVPHTRHLHPISRISKTKAPGEADPIN